MRHNEPDKKADIQHDRVMSHTPPTARCLSVHSTRAQQDSAGACYGCNTSRKYSSRRHPPIDTCQDVAPICRQQFRSNSSRTVRSPLPTASTQQPEAPSLPFPPMTSDGPRPGAAPLIDFLLYFTYRTRSLYVRFILFHSRSRSCSIIRLSVPHPLHHRGSDT